MHQMQTLAMPLSKMPILYDAEFSGALLTHANLEGAGLNRSQLANADLRYASLCETSVNVEDLQAHIKFVGANLTKLRIQTNQTTTGKAHDNAVVKENLPKCTSQCEFFDDTIADIATLKSVLDTYNLIQSNPSLFANIRPIILFHFLQFMAKRLKMDKVDKMLMLDYASRHPFFTAHTTGFLSIGKSDAEKEIEAVMTETDPLLFKALRST